MSHSNNRFNNRIWTNESVYRDSPIGNLERIMVSGISPHTAWGPLAHAFSRISVCKQVAYNITVLISAMFELKIEPNLIYSKINAPAQKLAL
jgi:hypothetical protein